MSQFKIFQAIIYIRLANQLPTHLVFVQKLFNLIIILHIILLHVYLPRVTVGLDGNQGS